MTAFLIALTPGPARAADCGLLGTSCVTDTLGQTAGGAVSTVQETVDQTVDEVVTAVEETVDETVDQVVGVVENVADTVKKTPDKVVDTVDETVNTVNDTVGAVDPVVAPPPPNGGSEQGSNDPAGNGSRPDTETSVVRPQGRGRSAPTLHVDLVAETSPAGDTVVVNGTSSTSPLDQPGPFAGSLPEIARRLAFPLVLVGLVLGFVAIQNRLDRRDPKLALASTTRDVLNFT
ncbi:MAG TPA: hypothetical protein VFZ50_07130 [Actinomycetota bacterium]|nr:hypothetical protein [Actinomycetota bacterium]